ncbi:MAG TPA: DUF3616 domain-containing protein [Falsiroseomonas sp.]|nr:DUF3616 domain-containing protein [Falsiroseomonas sp.]
MKTCDRPAVRIGQAEFTLSDACALRRLDDPVAKDLSAVARAGTCIFLACDEAAGLERLTRIGDGRYGAHRHILLSEFFDLPGGPEEEMDIEGLAAAGGYLWIIGSHALKRKKPDEDDHNGAEALAHMREIERESNRFFLGRLPLEEGSSGIFTPKAKVGDRRAACLSMGGAKEGLTRWFRKDPHIAPFLKVPCKENGLDIEGIAVRGERVWLGLRGPVLGGYTVVLDLVLKEPKRGRLKPRQIASGGQRYRKHLLETGGLGVRDLRLDGEDLLLLVGPTMALEGTAHVLRWRGAVHDEAEGLVSSDRLELLADLPYRRETNHPEGLELWPDGGSDAFVVVYDAPGPERLDRNTRTVRADILRPADNPPRMGRR